MKHNQWTLALAAVGVVSLGSIALAEEAQHPVMSAIQGTTLSGYVDTSAIWKFGTGEKLVGRSYDGAAKQDGFNLNAIKLTLEKPLDEGQWSAGYKVDLLFGPDANTYNTTSSGVANSDFAIKQAYVNLRAPIGNGLDFQMGVFDTVIGYEVFDSYANPNYSRSYGFAIEPTTHTGLLASYRLTDWAKFSAGIADTVVSTINARAINTGTGAQNESQKTYMALLELTAPESLGFLKDAKVFGGVVDGLDNVGFGHWTSFYAGTSIPTPITGLSFGAAYDYRASSAITTANSTYANATAVYLKYQMNDKLSFANRAEYASGTASPFASWGGGNAMSQVKANGDADGGQELFGETFTIDYRPWGPNVITRAEFRWDHDLRGGVGAFGGGTEGDKNALSLALNVIYRF